jgi:hypothetical protein
MCVYHFAKLGDSSNLDVDVHKFEIAIVLVDLFVYPDACRLPGWQLLSF